MKLPAFTLCLASLGPFNTNATLDGSLLICEIGETECDIKDFYSIETRSTYNIFTCYVLNGGRNSSGHSREIKSTTGLQDSSLESHLSFTFRKTTLFFIPYTMYL
jgi:hypothetical protein